MAGQVGDRWLGHVPASCEPQDGPLPPAAGTSPRQVPATRHADDGLLAGRHRSGLQGRTGPGFSPPAGAPSPPPPPSACSGPRALALQAVEDPDLRHPPVFGAGTEGGGAIAHFHPAPSPRQSTRRRRTTPALWAPPRRPSPGLASASRLRRRGWRAAGEAGRPSGDCPAASAPPALHGSRAVSCLRLFRLLGRGIWCSGESARLLPCIRRLPLIFPAAHW